MHFTEVVELLASRGYDVSNLKDADTTKTNNGFVILYNCIRHPIRWYFSVRLPTDYSIRISFDKNWNTDRWPLLFNNAKRIYTYNLGKDDYIKYDEDGTIMGTKNSYRFPNINIFNYNYELAETMAELLYVFLWDPDNGEYDSDIGMTLFTKNNEIVFITVKENCNTDSTYRIYDKYSAPQEYEYVFENTSIRPIPYKLYDPENNFDEIDIMDYFTEYNNSIIIGMDYIWESIEKNMVPIYKYEMISMDIFNDKNRYKINVYDILRDIDIEEPLRHDIFNKIVEEYGDEYIIYDGSDYIDTGLGICINVSMNMFVEEYNPYIIVPKNTVIRFLDTIMPLKYDTKCIDITRLSNDMYVFLLKNIEKIGTTGEYTLYFPHGAFMFGKVPELLMTKTIFKIYVSDNIEPTDPSPNRIQPLILDTKDNISSMKPYEIYDTHIDVGSPLPSRVTTFRSTNVLINTTKWVDINIICQ